MRGIHAGCGISCPPKPVFRQENNASTSIFFAAARSAPANAKSVATSAAIRYFLFVMIEQLPEVQRLTDSEKFQLATELWDQLATSPEPASDPRIVRLLEQRYAEFVAGKHPSRFSVLQHFC